MHVAYLTLIWIRNQVIQAKAEQGYRGFHVEFCQHIFFLMPMVYICLHSLSC